jgi:branched-chain amino acid transport system substrate-binding protein
MLEHRRKKRGVMAIVAMLSLASSALTLTTIPAEAASTNAQTGITASTIKLGITVPLTGAAAPGYNKVPYAMRAYFNYVNDNGGVNGRKISLIIKDDAYSPTLAKSVTNDLILKDKVFALVGTLGTANTEATTKFVNDHGVPRLFVNSGFSGFTNTSKYPTTYTLLPSYVMEAKIMGQYIKDNFAGKSVAIIYQDDDFGADALKGFGIAGTSFVAKIPYASGSQADPTVVGKWIAGLAAAKPDVTIMFGVSSATAAALGGSYKAGFKTQWILGSVGGDGTTIASVAGATAVGLLYGSIGASFLPSPADTADEYVAQFQAINAKYNAGAVFDNNVLVAMNTAMMTVQALRAAGSKLTRTSLMDAIAAKGSTFASAGFAPLGYSSTSHVGYNGYWFGVYGPTGNMKPTSGAYTLYTTDSGTGAVVKTATARPAMPAKGLPTN